MAQSTLAEALRVMRARRGLTLSEASELIGVNRQTIRDLELGKRDPYGPTLRKLAAGYGVSVEELLATEESAPAGKVDAPTGTARIVPSESDDMAGLLAKLGSRTQRLADPNLVRNLEGAIPLEIATTFWEVARELELLVPELARRREELKPDHPAYMASNRIEGEATQRVLELNMFLRWQRGAELREEVVGGFRERAQDLFALAVAS